MNGKKFNVVEISIDQKPETYKIAIARENVPWNYLICDFKGWDSPLIDTFNIENIPANFLLDPSGKIIAKNIFNDEVENELQKNTKKCKPNFFYYFFSSFGLIILVYSAFLT